MPTKAYRGLPFGIQDPIRTRSPKASEEAAATRFTTARMFRPNAMARHETMPRCLGTRLPIARSGSSLPRPASTSRLMLTR